MFFLYHRRRQTLFSLPSATPWLPWAGAALTLLASGYAYFVRPKVGVEYDRFFFWPAGAFIRSYREDTFVRLGWYWQPWGLAWATAGVAALAFQLRAAWQKTFWLLGAGALCVLCYDLRNNPVQPYAMRRLVPAASPLLISAAATFGAWAVEAWRRGRPGGGRASRWGPAVTVVTGAVLLVGFRPVNNA